MATTTDELDVSLHAALVETNLGSLDALASEIEQTEVYALTQQTLKQWAIKLKGLGDMLGKHLHHADTCRVEDSPPPERSRTPSKAVKRKESLGAVFREDADVAEKQPATVATHIASTVHLLLDALCHMTHAEWSTCYVYVDNVKKLVMIGGAGKRAGCPGDVSLLATSGIEGLVLENGIGVSMSLATTEREFSGEQDSAFRDHTRAMLVFPVFKPGSSSSVIGVLEVGNRLREGPFTQDEERTVSDCSTFIASIISRFPNDVTNSKTLDKTLVNRTKEADRSRVIQPERQSLLVYRTNHQSVPRKSDIGRDAVTLPRGATIENALDHIAHVNEAWRSAVLLNVELEHEIRRLHEALRVSRRETARLQESSNPRINV